MGQGWMFVLLSCSIIPPTHNVSLLPIHPFASSYENSTREDAFTTRNNPLYFTIKIPY